MTERLGSWAVFAGVLAAAGLPIYIHAPKFYVDTYGVSLAALGSVLFALRLVDVVQDPFFGRIAGALGDRRALAVGVAGAVMAAGMAGLFAVTPPFAPILWFALMLTLVFSAFSFLTIVFYATGVARAASLPGQGHLRLARWRETGTLLGVSLAALLPTLLAAAGVPGFAGFALIFAGLVALAVWLMHREWGSAGTPPRAGFGPILRDPTARRLLLVALLNATPVAVTSTLFLFYVESVLDAPGWEGPLLLLFFLAAAAAAPFWGLLAERFGAKPVLLGAMALAIGSFGWALFLGAGDTVAFAAICIGSGAALGADLTLLPAIFARRLSRIAPEASEGFALWSFVSKFTLAFAAVVLLPVLDARGFQSGAGNSAEALATLSMLYAGIPCVLKLVALTLLAATTLKEEM